MNLLTTVDMASTWDEERTPVSTEYLRRDDGNALLYPGRLHWLFGRPESGKSWLALVATAELLRDHRDVLYLDYETDAWLIRDRLKALGVTKEEAVHLRYVEHPSKMPDDDGSEEYCDFIDSLEALLGGVHLVVVDACAEAMGAQGYDVCSNPDTEAFVNTYLRRLQKHGAAVLVIDHVAKAETAQFDGSGAIGASHKRAAADVEYRVTTLDAYPFGRGREGRASVKVEKDRLGAVRGFADSGKHVAQLVLHSTPDGATVTASLSHDGTRVARAKQNKLEEVSRFLEDNGPCPKRVLEDGVGGKRDYVREALDWLIAKDYAAEERKGNALIVTSLREFRAGTHLELVGAGVPA